MTCAIYKQKKTYHWNKTLQDVLLEENINPRDAPLHHTIHPSLIIFL